MKLLLYCTKEKKQKELLWCNHKYTNGHQFFMDGRYNRLLDDLPDYLLNGKIIAECDFEVEKIRKGWGCLNGTKYFRNSVEHYYPDYELEQQSCLGFNEIDKYLKGTLNENCGYAIHIKNLHIFDKPRELKIYSRYAKVYDDYVPIEVAPQNMMYAFEWDYDIYYDKCILISIQPQWLCKILNGEKTIEVRKKVLKEMLG